MRRRLLAALAALVLLSASAGCRSDRALDAAAAPPVASQTSQWVCTQAPAGWWTPERQASSPLQPAEARLLHLSGATGGLQVRPVSDGFAAACDPSIDGQGELWFAGRRRAEEGWRLWRRNLTGGRATPFAAGGRDAHQPVWLPRDILVWVAPGPWGGWSLWRSAPEGGEPEPITCTPHDALHPTLLRDGRLLFVLRRSLADGPREDLFTLHPDGTQLTRFADGGEEAGRCGPPRETWGDERQVVFTADSHLTTVALKRPLRLRERVAGLSGQIESACPLPDGTWLLAYRPPETESFGLYPFDPRRAEIGAPLYDDPAFDEIQPVWAGRRPLSKALLSVVYLKEDVASGRAFCVDARQAEAGALQPLAAARRVRVWQGTPTPQGIERRLWGEAPLQPDGSFFVELPANIPLQWETLDENGEPVAQHHTWTWVRPNENQACVGCHHSPEVAPPNRVLDAFVEGPVVLGATPAP